jgi:hypothetical protein
MILLRIHSIRIVDVKAIESRPIVYVVLRVSRFAAITGCQG